jgi:DNA-binding NtrC family response regulator
MDDKDVSMLIVDDDEPTRNGMVALLGLAYTCIAAASAEEAMRLLAARSFKLVITDIHMPGASGLELCRFVHKLCPNTVVIVVSGMTDIRYQIEALRQGTLYYIEKPIDPEKLFALVESALKCQALSEARHRNARPANSLRARAS